MIAVIRHGDRTPKQKMKMEVRHQRYCLCSMFNFLCSVLNHCRPRAVKFTATVHFLFFADIVGADVRFAAYSQRVQITVTEFKNNSPTLLWHEMVLPD